MTDMMRAITVQPRQAASTRLELRPVPEMVCDNDVLVRTRLTGVCGTDMEIAAGLYGEAPAGDTRLILGHETVGVVTATGRAVRHVKVGDTVTRIVRRPCPDGCVNCATGAPHMCDSGNYTEAGIKGVYGAMADYFCDREEYLVPLPPALAETGVLMAPFSFCEKTVRQVYAVQQRLQWRPRTALVLGCGPIGFITALLLRLRGLTVVSVGRRTDNATRAALLARAGITYHALTQVPLAALPPAGYDLIVEASTHPALLAEAFPALAPKGVVALTSITHGTTAVPFPLETFNREFVLGNRVLLGVVNAGDEDYVSGSTDAARCEERWPGLLTALLTRRVSPAAWRDGFTRQRDDVKVVADFMAA